MDVYFILHRMQCFLKHNAPGLDGRLPGAQRCGMEIMNKMDGAKDTPTCLRRNNMVTNLRGRMYYCATFPENKWKFDRHMPERHPYSPLEGHASHSIKRTGNLFKASLGEELCHS